MSVGYQDDNSWKAYIVYLLTKAIWPSSSRSLSSRLDAFSLLRLSAYDLLTAVQAAAFHLALFALLPSLLSPLPYALFLLLPQLCIAVYAYRSFLQYVDQREGGKRGLYRFSLLPRPDSGDDLPSLSAAVAPDNGTASPQLKKVRELSSAATPTAAAAASSPLQSPPTPQSSSPATSSPLTRARRLSATETIAAMKQPLLHSQVGRRQKLRAFDSNALQSINPFVNKTFFLSRHEHVRLALAAGFLLPFRAAAFIALFIPAYLHCKLCVWGVLLADIQSRPLSGWRRIAVGPVGWYCRLLLFALGYVWVEESGQRAAGSAAPLVVCNHVGFVEPLLLVWRFVASPVGAEENLTLPIVGVICQALQSVPVRRKDRASRGELIRTLKRRCEQPGWPQIVIFPEGTTTNGQSIIQFKAGAFIPAAPVQPVAVRFPTGSRLHPAWVSCGPSPGQLLIRLLCEPFSRVQVEYLPVHEPTAAEKADAALYANNVRASIAAALQVPVTNHSYEDALLAEAAWASPLYRSLPSTDRRQTTSIELASLQTVFHLDAPSALLHLQRFSSLDVRGVGRLRYDELRDGLGVKDGPEMRSLFAAMDEDDCGEIDLREYLLGLGMIEAAAEDGAQLDGGSGGHEMRLKLICRILDSENAMQVRLAAVQAALARSELDEQQTRAALERLQRLLGEGRDTLSYDELTEALRADPLLYDAMRAVLFSALPLPAADSGGSKQEAVSAVIQAEAKGWRKKLKEGVGKIKRRFS